MVGLEVLFVVAVLPVEPALEPPLPAAGGVYRVDTGSSPPAAGSGGSSAGSTGSTATTNSTTGPTTGGTTP